ncbi:HU family DNA-binding protein, partial [bacterium]|nr:HU family DNA-binding protein [bacterium]
MNRAELSQKIAQETGMTIKDSLSLVDIMTETIVKALQNGEKVEIRGFGSFNVKSREAREGRNPKSGAKISIAA